ncbi:MAG: class 1 fructose-bisphosphatase [Thermoanaerobaculia bacterium]
MTEKTAPGSTQVTLTQYLIENQKSHPGATGEFTDLLNRIALCGKIIASRLRRSTLTGETGYARTSNVYGERQEKLDVFANDVFLRHLRYGSIVTLAASEEMAEPAALTRSLEQGHYTICFDPIDGSANLDVNGTLGTIFGIRPRAGSDSGGLLTSGRTQVAAGYLLYGPATQLVFTAGNGVAIFTLEVETGEFYLAQDRIEMPRSGKNYAVNEGNSSFWKDGTRRFVEWLKTPDPKTGSVHSTRYSASLVGDFHRILHQGGIYLYPEDRSDPKKPDGKLRVLYECHPLAMVAEQAGGRASTGKGNVLDLVPDSFHARCPLAIGSKDEVGCYEEFVGNA